MSRAAAETSALELESPELGGMFPQTAARIPEGTLSSGTTSRAPFTPQRKYLYQSGPLLASLMQTLRGNVKFISLFAARATTCDYLELAFNCAQCSSNSRAEERRIVSKILGRLGFRLGKKWRKSKSF